MMIRTRVVVGIIFTAFLLVALFLSILPNWTGKLSQDNMISLMMKVFSLYTVHLGVIAGGIFGEFRKEKTDEPDAAKKTDEPDVQWFVVLFCLIWNLLVIWRFFPFNFGHDSNERATKVIEYLDFIPQYASCLITGALAYMFTNRKTSS